MSASMNSPQETMDESSPSLRIIGKAILATLAGALLACTIALLLLQTEWLAYYFPKEQQLYQKFLFKLSPEVSLDKYQKDFFVSEQKYHLLRLSQQHTLPITRFLDVKPQRNPLGIHLVLCCPADRLVKDDFEKLVEAYRQYHRDFPPSAVTKLLNQNPDPYENRLLQRLEQNQAEIDQYQRQLLQLQFEYNNLTAESVAMEQQLHRKDPNTWPISFEQSINSQVEKFLADDALLQQARKNLDSLQQCLAAIDLQAAREKDTERLEALLKEKNEIRRQSLQLRQQMDHRRGVLTAPLKQQHWPAYQIEMNNQLATLGRLMVNNTADRKTLGQALRMAQEQQTTLRNEMQLWRRQFPPPGPELMPDFRIGAVLQDELPPTIRIVTWSSAQYLLLAISALLGTCLGWLINFSFWHVRPRKKPQFRLDDGLRVDDDPLEQQSAQAPPDAKEPFLSGVDEEFPAPALAPDETSKPSWKPPYDAPTDEVVRLKEKFGCPVVLLSTLKKQQASLRPVVNLAISLTRREMNVLLVNADTTEADFAQIFDIPESPGLLDLCQNRVDLPQASYQTQLPGLTVMPAGSPVLQTPQQPPEGPPQPTRAFFGNSPDRQNPWSSLAKLFDTILIYSPDALHPLPQPADSGSAGFLDLADGVFCLNRSLRTVRRDVRKAHTALQGRKARFLGLITPSQSYIPPANK